MIGEGTRYIALQTFQRDLGENVGVSERGFAAMSAIRDTREVPRERYPLLVTFTDIADPTTVRRVDPDDLAATFGPGVSLRRVTLEITDETVTEGSVEQLLTWLDSYYDQRLDGNRFGTIEAPNRLANDLSAGNFDTKK